MISETPAESPFSPHRWFLGAGGRVRPFWRAVIFLVLGYVLVGLLEGTLASLAGGPLSLRLKALNWALLTALVLLESWLLLALLDRRSFRTLGLWFHPDWIREVLLGAAIGAGLMTVVVLALVGSGLVVYQGPAGVTPAGALRVVALAVFLFLAAAFEEIAFRGYGFQRLVESIGPWGAVAFFSALFGAVHLDNPAATPLSTVNTFLSGVLLSLAYLKTRALWLPIGLHWAWNLLMGPIFSLPVSGFRFGAPWLRVQVAGPDWLSGGAYGPEGGVVLTLVCLAGAVWLARDPRIRACAAMAAVLKSPPPEAGCGKIG